MKLRDLYTPLSIREWVALLREKGLKGFIAEKGWEVVLAIFTFYLVRDTVFYIIIPLLIAHGILSH